MPGLKQAGIISNSRLTLHIAKQVYAPVPRTLALWAHTHLLIMFSRVVDNFGVKYNNDASAHRIIASLHSLYIISVNWSRSLFCVLTLAWDYVNRTVDVSTSGYNNKELHKLQHPHPKLQQDPPHAWTHPAYGSKVQ